VKKEKALDIKEISAGLSTLEFIHNVYYRKSVGSTNDWASEYVTKKGIKLPSLFLTDRQTSGKGRRGRKWHSPGFVNMYASLAMKNDLPLQDSLLMTMVAALSIKDALRTRLDISSRIKWPNDVMIHGKKVSGILVETAGEHIIIGIGLNINLDTSQIKEISSTATSLSEIRKKSIPREQMIIEVFRHFSKNHARLLNDKMQIFNKWKKALLLPKNEREIMANGKTYKGIVSGVDSHGLLLFTTTEGEKMTFPTVESF